MQQQQLPKLLTGYEEAAGTMNMTDEIRQIQDSVTMSCIIEGACEFNVFSASEISLYKHFVKISLTKQERRKRTLVLVCGPKMFFQVNPYKFGT